MLRLLLTISVLILCVTSFAQPAQKTSAQLSSSSSIEDSVFGWYKVYHFKGAKESQKMGNRVYSTAQLSVCDSLANWIQASYIPKGGIGDVKKVIFPKENIYAPYTIGLPQGFGVTSYLWSMEWKKDKIVPIQETEIPWGIAANEVPGTSINMLSTEKQFYFFMEEGDPFYEGTSEEVRKKYEIKTLPQFRKYPTWHLKSSRYDRNAGIVDAVLLSKNNQIPFIPVSIGELLQKTGEMIQVKHELEKKKIIEKAQGNQRDIDYFTKYEDAKFEKAKTSVTKLMEKYKARLTEPAALHSNYDYIDLVNGYDMFTRSQIEESPGSVPQVFPVYKLAPNTYELCKKDQPQWMLVTWSWTTSNASELYMHESIINNFNFDYVYNFFFDPEKIKGQPYQPLSSPNKKETVVISQASETSKKNTADKNIHFFEDFSTTSPGKKPTGWKSTTGTFGSTSVVTALDGLSGNWAVVSDYTITPNQLKNPLPQNFTLSYDLVVKQNFTWGAKGLTFQLSKETSPGNAESYLKIRVRPGYDGRGGETVVEANFASPPGYLNSTKWMDAPGFSNNKKNNQITVTIKKNQELLQVFIDKTKIAEYEKAIPAGLLFNAMSLYSFNSGENDKFYISNIKITKD
jgi:hypothetical protein